MNTDTSSRDAGAHDFTDDQLLNEPVYSWPEMKQSIPHLRVIKKIDGGRAVIHTREDGSKWADVYADHCPITLDPATGKMIWRETSVEATAGELAETLALRDYTAITFSLVTRKDNPHGLTFGYPLAK
jgi:hypothetical protein